MKFSIIIFLFFSCVAFESQAQKIKVKNEIVTVDGEEYVRVKKFKGTQNYVIYTIDSNERIIFAQAVRIDQEDYSDRDDPDRYRFTMVKFLDLNLNCEIEGITTHDVIRFMLDENILVNGKVSEENARSAVLKHGSKFSIDIHERPVSITIELGH